jgi:periplasmic divalent cation tolerance protein
VDFRDNAGKRGNAMETKFVYVTTSDIHEAKKIGRLLVEKRLAACINILSTIESLFWWEGRVQETGEAAFIAKTTRERVPDLIAAVKANHSYECPCVVTLSIEEGNPDFLKWIADETSPS